MLKRRADFLERRAANEQRDDARNWILHELSALRWAIPILEENKDEQ